MACVYARIFYFDVDFDAYGETLGPIFKGELSNDETWDSILSKADEALKVFRKDLRTALLKDIKHRKDYGDEWDQKFSLTMQDYIVGRLVEKWVVDFSEDQLLNIRKSIKCEDDVPRNEEIQMLVDEADDTAVEILRALSGIELTRLDDGYIFRSLASGIVNVFR